MKSKYSIGLITFIIVIIYLIYNSIGDTSKTKPNENQIEQSIQTEGQVLKQECYYLCEVNGYVVVYLEDKKTLYEYTDIAFQTLPEILRKEIKNGKYIESQEELYGFLENYTS